jgi:predicted nucleic acid-binding protein
VEENETTKRATQLREDPVLAVWWGTPVECESAIQRRYREKAFSHDEVIQACTRLDAIGRQWMEIPPSSEIRRIASRLLRTHALRTADALQLSAAILLAGEFSSRLEFVCSDERLVQAAFREGLEIIH